MLIRSSENNHDFQARLFSYIGIHSCQGIMMDENHNYSAIVEAWECQNQEELAFKAYSDREMFCKLVFARELGVPFYVVYYSNNWFKIYEISERNGVIYYDSRNLFMENDFVKWWGYLKEKIYQKPLLNGGEERINKTVFDEILRNHGYDWGGNIDGFMLTESMTHVRCVIDCISVSNGIENDEPGRYFNSPVPKHGPKYDGWYGTVKCSVLMRVPHILITLDKRNPKLDHVGLTAITGLSQKKNKIKNNVRANENIVCGMENIKREIEKICLSTFPPYLEDKYSLKV